MPARSSASRTRTSLRSGGSTIEADGRFSLGYPRRDLGEEINARVRVTKRPIRDLRHAFLLDDYPVEGLLSGEFHLYGKYETPLGFGRLEIADGVAYGEPFERADARAPGEYRVEQRLAPRAETGHRAPSGDEGRARAHTLCVLAFHSSRNSS